MRKLIAFFATCVATFLFANHAFPNPLHDAITAENYKLVEALAKTDNLDEQDKEGNTPLLLAVKRNNTKIVEILVKTAASQPSSSTTTTSDILGLYLLNKNGETALSVATTPEIIYQLTQLNEELLPQLIQNPWVIAVLRNDTDGFIALLSTLDDTDFELDLTDPGQTLLHWMAVCKNFLFVNHFNEDWIRESINAQNSQGNTPLHYAAANGNADHISLLHNLGANATIANNDGKTPYDLALKYEYTAAAQYLSNTTGNQYSSASSASSASAALQSTDAAAGAAPAYNNSLSRSLFQTTGYNTTERVRELLEKKADPNAKNKSNQTPIFTAIFNENVRIVQLLLDNGADVNASDEFGNTPLLWALIHCKLSTIIELLLNYGADVSANNLNGDTPLYLALINNLSHEIIERLHAGRHRLNEQEIKAKRDYYKRNPLPVTENNNLPTSSLPNSTAPETEASFGYNSPTPSSSDGGLPFGFGGRSIL